MIPTARSYVAWSTIAGGALFYAVRLSAPERSTIDWLVMAAIGAALLWSLVQLAIRMHRIGGGPAVWHVVRTVLFWGLGWRNTWFLAPDDVGSVTHWIGGALLVLAAADTIGLGVREQRGRSHGEKRPPADRPEGTPAADAGP